MDSGADRQVQLKLSLKKLGQARQSKKLLDAASDSMFHACKELGKRFQLNRDAAIETYDQALAFLNAEHVHTDDTITALYTAKVCLLLMLDSRTLLTPSPDIRQLGEC